MKDFMKIEVVSRECIKPSCQTPPHLRSLDLSLLDQLSPSWYVPLILFYNSNIFEASMSRQSNLIKKSLAETLTRFYPFAGSVKDNRFVDCNDNGVGYLEARVTKCKLSELLQCPDVLELEKQFLPFDPYGSETFETLLAIQVNFFEECGGIAIGFCISHKIADASSLITFINDWAATVHGATEHVKGASDFKFSSLFPPREEFSGFTYTPLITREESVTKKFVFQASKIAELKKRSIPNNRISEDVRNQDQYYLPTRVEVVSAFIWRCFMNIYQAKQDQEDNAVKIIAASFAVNIRTRIVPPLPTSSIGNIETVAYAVSTINDNEGCSEKEYHLYPNLVSKIRNAIKKIDGDYIRELQTTDELLKSYKLIDEGISSGEKLLLHFSSWCRFPIYEADFGWGKPIWVSICKLAFKNLVYLMDIPAAAAASSSSGDGIEAWVSLTKEDMTEFERDEELLAFVS